MITSGRVIEEQKNYFLVDTQAGVIRSGIKGKLKKVKTRICVGDLVQLEITNQDELDGVIVSVEKRSSFIHRPALANITQIILITSLKSPQLDLEALDRMLFTTEAYSIRPVIVFNKTDLLSTDEISILDGIANTYSNCGYSVFSCSVQDGSGIEKLGLLCENQISAFSGLSGVGKSSILSKLIPDKSFKIGNVSGVNGRGTHTTTNIILHPYSNNGYIADTPGMSFVDIPTVSEENVIAHFPEINDCTGKCKFNNCIHDGEPGCLVAERVSTNEIASSRWEHYMKIYNEMKTIRKQYRKSADR